jgi:hypothetical protein
MVRAYTIGDEILDTPIEYEDRIISFRRFLPKGPVAVGEPSSPEGHRKDDLVQIYTDHGFRTIATHHIIKVR